jgi:integrase
LKWVKLTRAENTYKRIEYSFEPLLDFFGESLKVDRIEKKEIEKFVFWRKNQTSRKTKKLITRETINRELCCLKMLFRRLCDADILEKNQARLVKQLPENERTFHVITESERKRYSLAAPSLLSDVFNLMLETGLRCGEAYQLKRDDVNLEGNYLQVTKGKTKSSIRRVHLTDKARNILTARISRFDGENLFPHNDIDGRESTGSLVHIHLKTIRPLGFDFRIYDARHTFASKAVEDGVDLVVLANILGHTNLKMLMRYAHPSENMKAEAIRKMEKKKVKAVG